MTLESTYAFFETNYKIKDGEIIGELYQLDSRSRYRVWRVIIRLLDSQGNKVPITRDLVYQSDLDPGYKAEYLTQGGVMDGTIRSYKPKTVLKGKNIGRKNQTTVLTQAIRETISKYNSTMDRGYTKTKEEATTLDNMFELDKWRISCPAFHRIDDNWQSVSYPIATQCKIDGERLLAVFDTHIYQFDKYPGLGLFTRSRKLYYADQPAIIASLYDILKQHPRVYLDGEIAILGMPFHLVSGYARRQEESVPLNYYVFDCFIPEDPLMKYLDRLDRLRDILRDSPDNIVQLPTYTVHTRSELEAKMSEFLDNGCEGSIIRQLNGVYGYSFTREKRVRSVLKWKREYDDEWPVVTFYAATGEHSGAILWTCKTKKGEEFSVGFHKGVFSIAERQQIYTQLSSNLGYFNQYFKDQPLTIKYQALTETGKPIRGGAYRFRNADTQARLMDLLA